MGNCIVFDQLEEFYPENVREFRRMVDRHKIVLPRGVNAGTTDEQYDEMIRVALSLDPLWENALGPDWKELMTADRARKLYKRM